jgi:hypothetical protein
VDAGEIGGNRQLRRTDSGIIESGLWADDPGECMPHLRLSIIFATLLAASACPTRACQIPVFRYALERWQPGAIEVVVFHRGPLTKSQQAAIAAIGGSREAPTNTTVAPVDLDDKPVGQAAKLWAAQPEAARQSLPWLVVRPADGDARHARDIWAGHLDDASVAILVDSPARREIAGRILKGESAVWVLVESGDKAKDDAAAKVLAAELPRLQTDLQLPVMDPAAPGPRLLSNLPVAVKFSVLSVSRKDRAEGALVSMLTYGITEAKDAAVEPVVVPVFGQGRALIQLAAKDIEKEQVDQVAKFLVGECSCQVKELNPGFDLLLAADWQAILTDKGNGPEPKNEIPEPVIGSGKVRTSKPALTLPAR